MMMTNRHGGVFAKLALLPALLLLGACSNSIDSVDRPDDVPTRGEAKVSVDESVRPLFESQHFVFESSYDEAKLIVSYQPEYQVLTDVLKDSTVQVGVLCRDLTAEEKNYLDAKGYTPSTMQIAEDAVALIVNNENHDSLFTVEQVKRILQGQDTLWTSINEKSALGRISVVFDGQGSANARFLSEKLLGGQPFAPNCFALKSNPEVIDYVAKNPGALGIISVNWISDKDDSLCRARREMVKVVSVKGSDTTDFVPPWQTYIGDHSYPFHREVWIVKIGARTSLGTGFVSFVAQERGQLIILKSGLVPSRQPERRIELKTF